MSVALTERLLSADSVDILQSYGRSFPRIVTLAPKLYVTSTLVNHQTAFLSENRQNSTHSFSAGAYEPDTLPILYSFPAARLSARRVFLHRMLFGSKTILTAL